MKTIEEQIKQINVQLEKLDLKMKKLKAKLKYVRSICDHANATEWEDSGWGRMSSTEWHCPTCGLHKSH